MELYRVSQGTTPGGIRVRGQELIQVLTSASTTLVFGANNNTNAGTFNMTPVNFPRLSQIAPTYEMYKFHECSVYFQSNQPTTAAGVAEIAIDYDSKDSTPSTSVAMMRNISSSMSNVYSDLEVTLLGSLSRLPRYYVSEDTSPDVSQTIQAKAYYSFEGVTGVNAAQGYMVIRYDIEFFTPC